MEQKIGHGLAAVLRSLLEWMLDGSGKKIHFDDDFYDWYSKKRYGYWLFWKAHQQHKSSIVTYFSMYHRWMYLEAVAALGGLTLKQVLWILEYFPEQMDQPFFRPDMTDHQVANTFRDKA